MIKIGPITLRPEYQEPAHIATLEYMKSSNYIGPAFIDASVGAGKTILIGAQVDHWTRKGANVMVLARQGELVEQDADEAMNMGCKVSLFSASLKSKSTRFNCVMGTELTVSNHLMGPFNKNKWFPHVLLIDEAHHADFEEIEQCMHAKEKGKEFEVKTSYAKIIIHFLTIYPKLRIIGYTGSPYRGRKDILNKFWKKCIYKISTMELTAMGYLVPPVFGFGDEDHNYDLSEFKPKGGNGAEEYSSKELVAMQRKITKDKTRTEIIIEEVIERTKDRNGVLITCAGKKHCEQVAELLPTNTWAIITDNTSTKDRRKYLKQAKNGELKFILQVGCLTTGIDVSYWDTNVLLRKIGSLTLLTQLLGRTARLLKDFLSKKGIIKDDHLILDYAGVFESMGDIYDDPLLDKALSSFAEKTGPQKCPQCGDVNNVEAIECRCGHLFKQICDSCGTINSQYAIRCIGEDEKSSDGRCENFFNSQMCFATDKNGVQCLTENAPSAQSCRKCDAILIDPNRNLVNKAYTDADFKPVRKMELSKTKAGDGLCVTFFLSSTEFKQGVEHQEIAREYFKPFDTAPHNRDRWCKFIRKHIKGNRFQSAIHKTRTIDALIKNKAIFDTPTMITHRVNDKGFSIINRKHFRSGRVAE